MVTSNRSCRISHSFLFFILTYLLIPRVDAQLVPGGQSPVGKWRGVFFVRSDQQAPFNFEIEDGPNGQRELFFLNGEEKFYGGKVTQTGDSLFVLLNAFDNLLAVRIEGNKLTGVLERQDKTGTALQLEAEKGIAYRFGVTLQKPFVNIAGKYDIVFKSEDGKEEKAVGLFTQNGERLSATFLRITGDARYLEGVVSGDSFYLSSFIGSSPGLYKGRISSNGQLVGEAVYTKSNVQIAGVPNDLAELPDAFGLTYLKPGYDRFDFSLSDVDGRKISLQDEKFRGKVVVITITGTWCPNCIDEAAFLAPWYKENKSRGVEVVSIYYERQTDTAFIRKVLTRFRERFDIQYTQVAGGLANKQKIADSFPSLDTFLAFPTTIFVGRDGKVAKIHTGFSGPATGKYYGDFVREFNGEIDSLLK